MPLELPASPLRASGKSVRSARATPHEITGFIHAHRSALLVGMVLNTAAISLWLVFGVGVWVRLRQASGENLLTALYGLAFVAFITLLYGGFTAFFLLAYRDQQASDPRLLYDLTFGLLAMSGIPTAISLGAFAGLILRERHLPRRTARYALVAVAAHVGLLASFIVTNGFFSLEGSVIIAFPVTLFAWIAATTSRVLLSGAHSDRAGSAP